jgi:hypothetical protein
MKNWINSRFCQKEIENLTIFTENHYHKFYVTYMLMFNNSTKNEYTNRIQWFFILWLLKQTSNEKFDAFTRKICTLRSVKKHLFLKISKFESIDTHQRPKRTGICGFEFGSVRQVIEKHCSSSVQIGSFSVSDRDEWIDCRWTLHVSTGCIFSMKIKIKMYF